MRPCDIALRAALSRGPLVRDGRIWRLMHARYSGSRPGRVASRRAFACATVARLIASGEAVQVDADTITAAP